jgi:NAD(P)-dependent dehydrogenase (short-subunit alcohol dehydrogenase family)
MLRAMANEKTASDAATTRARVALVVCGDGDEAHVGRAIALSLAARDVRVVLVGADERAIAETVGEIAFGGGKARHVAGDPSDRAVLASAAARAVDVFGGLDLAIATTEASDAVFEITRTAAR